MFTRLNLPSPLGPLVAVARGEALACLVFGDHWERDLPALAARYGELRFSGTFPRPLSRALDAYFAGDIAALADVPVDIEGTDFELRVWNALRTIPAGATISYQELARRAGAPAAYRAAGNANGKNPVAIVIPCHRVVHADGSIGGYGGGLPRKRWLLDHEARHATPLTRYPDESPRAASQLSFAGTRH